MQHPAIDVLTARAAIVVQQREVVSLGTWLLDAVTLCASTGRSLQVLTGPQSRITVPLEQILSAPDARWVVRSADGTSYYDGLRGLALAWDGTQFAPAGPSGDPAAVAPELTARDRPTGGQLRIDVTVLHPADTEQVGRLVEDCFEALTRQPPAGWGVAEPATQRWGRRQLADLCRTRAPSPTWTVVVGGAPDAPAVATVDVARIPSGVTERVRLAVAGSQGPDLDAVERLACHLADLHPVRTTLASLHPGRGDTTLAPVFTGHPVPYALLVGSEGVMEVGIERAAQAPGSQVTLVGPSWRRSAWVKLLGSPAGEESVADPYAVLDQVFAHFGVPARPQRR